MLRVQTELTFLEAGKHFARHAYVVDLLRAGTRLHTVHVPSVVDLCVSNAYQYLQRGRSLDKEIGQIDGDFRR